jgi:hypothetical protein
MEVHMTLHMDVRMNHRGITADLVDLTLEYGEWEGDRCCLGARALKHMIEEMDRKRSTMLKALDKGGIVVVEAGGSEITTYPIKKRRGRLCNA